MGAVNFSNAIYLGISDGKISRRVQQATETSVPRTTKEGKLVHEEFFKGWKGRITNIATKENDYGKQWLVTLTDEDGDAILQMPYSSGYSSAFLKALPNVDMDSDVLLSPKMTMEGDKKKTTLFINQHGKAIKWYYTKDNPNGLPEMKQIKVKGKITWDDSEMMEFLEVMVKDVMSKKKPYKQAEESHDANSGEDEQTPF